MHGLLRRDVAAALVIVALAAPDGLNAGERKPRRSFDALIAKHAQANGVPAELIHRIIRRESRYNPRARGHGGALGLMQIKYSTARRLGYTGSPAGLLNPDTNLTYGVRYLAGAFRLVRGNSNRSFAYYKAGY